MQGFTSVNVIGNVSEQPELRYTQSGKAVVNVGLAINSKQGDTEKVFFLRCVAWEKLAETLSKYVSKGDPLFLSGSLDENKYTGAEGTEKKTLYLLITKMVFLKSKDKTLPKQTKPVEDDEIPF